MKIQSHVVFHKVWFWDQSFLIFINDLPKATEFFTLLFADDTTFQLFGPNLDQLFNLANFELSKAATWFKANKLTLNILKTKYIIFRKPNMHLNLNNNTLFIENTCIDRIGNNCEEKSFKFVGHHLDEFLTWDEHASYVKNKLSKSNYAINSSKNLLPLTIRKLLYNSLFRSHLEFGIIAWGGMKANQKSKIYNLHKKCVRNVANREFRSHCDPIFKSLKILKFPDLYKYNCILYMHKYAYARLPHSMLNMFTPLSVNNRTGNYLLQKYKYSFFDKFPSVSLLKFWNEQKSDIKNCLSYSSIKSKLKDNIVANYESNVKCKYDKCPDCS